MIPLNHANGLSTLERISLRATEWIGTTNSLAVHTALFAAAFAFYLAGIALDSILLILTTAVSLEAIYLAIFIQMTVNRTTVRLKGVEENIGEIHEHVEGIGEDIEELSEDIDVIQEEQREDDIEDAHTKVTLGNIQTGLEKLLADIAALRGER